MRDAYKHIDSVADILEEKGLYKYAYKLDVISNSIEASWGLTLNKKLFRENRKNGIPRNILDLIRRIKENLKEQSYAHKIIPLIKNKDIDTAIKELLTLLPNRSISRVIFEDAKALAAVYLGDPDADTGTEEKVDLNADKTMFITDPQDLKKHKRGIKTAANLNIAYAAVIISIISFKIKKPVDAITYSDMEKYVEKLFLNEGKHNKFKGK